MAVDVASTSAAVEKSDVMKAQTGASEAKLLPNALGGRVRVVHGLYTTAGGAAGTVIALARLPKGARVLPISQLHFEAGQDAAMTVAVGDSADNDRYLAAAAPGAAAVSVALTGNRFGDYTLPAEDVITATIGAKALATGKKIAFDLYYVVD